MEEKSLSTYSSEAVENLFASERAFMLACKMAATLAKSTIVPKEYQGSPGNCLIALEMAARLHTSPMMVMQNLYIVNGRPAWSSQYIVATINASRKYKTELQFELSGSGDSLTCFAWALDQSNHKVTGPTITIQMAKDEGWYGKSGSKWKTMPEVMIRYRAASFFGRLNCPDMIMGIYSTDEVADMGEAVEVQATIEANANMEALDFPDAEPLEDADQTVATDLSNDATTSEEAPNEPSEQMVFPLGF